MTDEQIFFSPASLGFYKGQDREYYEELGSWPSDVIEVLPEDQVLYWKQATPFDKVLGVVDGRPAWVSLPPPTPEELTSRINAQRDGLLREAALRIAPLQDAVDLEEATPQEVAALNAWKKYRVALSRIEQQVGFPSSVEWPKAPS